MTILKREGALWLFLREDLRGLIIDGENLLETIKNSPVTFGDYAFVVFPFAKAYEGFLKDLFLHLQLIDVAQYNGHRFRIGRALNPSLDKRFRLKESVYDRLSSFGVDKSFVNELWEVWKKGRNLTFHYFPDKFHILNLVEAEKIILEMLVVMEKSIVECRVDINSTHNHKTTLPRRF